MRQILLVEPAYRNKYPPLGLMKISTYHKLRGDRVVFIKGCNSQIRDQGWDRIYIATLFTFFWNETIRTIKFYIKGTKSPENVYIGGVMATLLADDIRKEVPVTVIIGLIDKPGILDAGSPFVVDHLIPDYRIIDLADYSYGLNNAYLGYATRGCPNTCPFCAVRKIEPKFVNYLPLKKQVQGIEAVYGPQKDLILLDNNVLASECFEKIIQDIIDLGFERDAKFEGKQRRIDFNQGIDARRLTRSKMELLANTAIKPLRMALDHISMKDIYIERVKLARDFGLLNHATYVLYNYTDTPKDFYERLHLSVILNEELGTKISSFPMKYIPLTAKDRSYIGKHWSKKLIRGVQCILLATKGIVSPRREFFEIAFGATADDFIEIALMPERYIIYRTHYKLNGALDWKKLYRRLGKSQKKTFLEIVSNNRVTKKDVVKQSSLRMRRLLSHYIEEHPLKEQNK